MLTGIVNGDSDPFQATTRQTTEGQDVGMVYILYCLVCFSNVVCPQALKKIQKVFFPQNSIYCTVFTRHAKLCFCFRLRLLEVIQSWECLETGQWWQNKKKTEFLIPYFDIGYLND